ncbi:MAG: DNA/RNA non-specific endonuclease [Saprospiraceae bacterium]|nr:DNA/RNA non-specific endonuclease [Saprospiraceae bacterium]
MNHNLHGPGKKWNLTPGTKEINAQMEKEVESKAKEAVEAGKVVFYEVQVNYHDIKGQEAFPREIGSNSRWKQRNGF